MGNRMMLMHYSEDVQTFEEISARSTATPASLRLLFEGRGFDVHGLDAGDSRPTKEFFCFDLTRAEIEHSQELAFWAASIVSFRSLRLHDLIALCHWLRSHIPETYPLHLFSDSGLPKFDLDFDNLEQQLRAEFSFPIGP